MFIGILIGRGNASNHIKYVSLNNQECTTQSTLILICIQINTLKVYITIHLQLKETDVLEVVILLMIYLIKHVSNEKEDLNLNIFNMIKEINESKILTKVISCKCKRRFSGKKYNSKQK